MDIIGNYYPFSASIDDGCAIGMVCILVQKI